MIAIVKIAPVEQWCMYFRTHFAVQPERIVGMPVEIKPARMKKGRGNWFFIEEWANVEHEDASLWPLTIESCNSLRAAFGLEPNVINVWICQHMLEMD